jgi:arsenate reductase
MTKVLFICVHNSARSQMAEAFLKKHGGGRFIAESAGLEPGKLNPFVVRAMNEIGIDISNNATKSVFDLFRQEKVYQVIITVCSKEAEERCPVFPGIAERHHWPFDDPSTFQGSDDEIMTRLRVLRDAIEEAVRDFVNRHLD